LVKNSIKISVVNLINYDLIVSNTGRADLCRCLRDCYAWLLCAKSLIIHIKLQFKLNKKKNIFIIL